MNPADAARALRDALILASQGCHCLPCAWSKRPTSPHGFQDASGDPVALRELWARHPGSLVGVRAGSASGLDILDLDRKHRDALQWWNAHRDRMPVTRVHRTRAGGLHLIFQHSPGTRCSANRIAPGVDIRADGGYFIWWPTMGLPVLSDAPVAPWPDWLLKLCARAEHKPISPCAPAVGFIPRRYRSRMRGIVARLLAARQGERNSFSVGARSALLRRCTLVPSKRTRRWQSCTTPASGLDLRPARHQPPCYQVSAPYR